jgi:glycosyltransferase involved in cell wall biosynthesis
MNTDKLGILPILPVYNEQARLSDTIEYYSQYLRKILVIDNYSTDDTLIIASGYPNVDICQKQNNGTTETQEWHDWLTSTFPSRYYLHLSCSERLSQKFLTSLSSFCLDSLDLVFTNRISFTGIYDTSLVYSKLSRAILGLPSIHEVCRFCSFNAIKVAPISIHSNFGPAKSLVRSSSFSDKRLAIIHHRDSDLTNIFKKHLDYARNTATTIHKPNHFLIKWISRELVFIFVALAHRKLSWGIFRELLARIVMHIQIYLYAQESKLIVHASGSTTPLRK